MHPQLPAPAPSEPKAEAFPPFDFVFALKTESCSVCLELEHLGQAIFVEEFITNCS